MPIVRLQVFFIYALRRVSCRPCGVKTEYLEWSRGKEQMTTAYKWFLSTWARRLSWSETARVFGKSWNRANRSVFSPRWRYESCWWRLIMGGDTARCARAGGPAGRPLACDFAPPRSRFRVPRIPFPSC